ncbi:MAG: Dna2/Cas4 domain-containing protein [bacterium]|nr:Dna2/Cas4 domain-containing protein [bacterium]
MKTMRRISDNDLANYVVCPYSWWLKREPGQTAWKAHPDDKNKSNSRSSWRSSQQTLSNLQLYSRVVYILLIMLAAAVFLWEPRAFIREHINNNTQTQNGATETTTLDDNDSIISQSVSVPAEIISLVIILGGAILLWDQLDRKKKSLSQDSGIKANTKFVAVHGGTDLPESYMHDQVRGLSGKPDAIIREDGQTIPINLLPTTKKIQDRHIIRLLLHLKLIESTYQTNSPYGILLVGKEKRSVKIVNTEERKAWLAELINEMDEIISGKTEAKALPTKFKCLHCDVRDRCPHAWRDET